jgi:hypothetical protein
MDSRKMCCTRYQKLVYLNIKTLCIGNTTLENLCLLAVMSSRLLNATWKRNWNNTVGKNHASIHFTISGHKILITLNLCYNVPCRNDCDITQKKRNLPLKHTVVNGQWQNILNTVLQNHTVEQNLTLTSLKEFVVLTYRFYLMFKTLKMKFILTYDHLKCHSKGTVQVISKCLQVTWRHTIHVYASTAIILPAE